MRILSVYQTQTSSAMVIMMPGRIARSCLYDDRIARSCFCRIDSFFYFDSTSSGVAVAVVVVVD